MELSKFWRTLGHQQEWLTEPQKVEDGDRHADAGIFELRFAPQP